MSDWGKGTAIQPWPKATADEPEQLWLAERQEYDGSWSTIIRGVPIADALKAARVVRDASPVSPETRVRPEGATR